MSMIILLALICILNVKSHTHPLELHRFNRNKKTQKQHFGLSKSRRIRDLIMKWRDRLGLRQYKAFFRFISSKINVANQNATNRLFIKTFRHFVTLQAHYLRFFLCAKLLTLWPTTLNLLIYDLSKLMQKTMFQKFRFTLYI